MSIAIRFDVNTWIDSVVHNFLLEWRGTRYESVWSHDAKHRLGVGVPLPELRANCGLRPRLGSEDDLVVYFSDLHKSRGLLVNQRALEPVIAECLVLVRASDCGSSYMASEISGINHRRR